MQAAQNDGIKKDTQIQLLDALRDHFLDDHMFSKAIKKESKAELNKQTKQIEEKSNEKAKKMADVEKQKNMLK